MNIQLDDVGREGVRNMLRNSVLDITFTKTNGSIRVMSCTLDEQFIPAADNTENSRTKTPNPDVCVVWDMENQAWRSFRWDSLTKIGI